MRKIPTLFLRDPDNPRYVTDEVNPACAWVLEGWGSPTRKYDGWCCRIDEAGEFWKRAEVKRDGRPQPGFVEVDHDETTGKRVGWVPVGDGPEDRWFREAFAALTAQCAGYGLTPYSGTYELVGPKVNGNPERFEQHTLIRHEEATPLDCPPDPVKIRAFVAELRHKGYEGIVWHHPDGRMAKLKRRDLREGRVR